jgi:hypothetical protein
MSTCPFNKVSGIGCPFYRDRDKGDYCACLQGDCPVEGPEEKVVDTKPIAVQETRPIPSKIYSVEEFFDVHEEGGVTLEEALLNRLWMVWEELDARYKERPNRNCLYSIPSRDLCEAGIAIFEYLKNKANYYIRD